MEVGDYAYGGFKVIVVASILILMQLLVVGGRLISRRLQKVWLGFDDYVLISAAIVTVTLCGLAIALPRIAGVSNWSLQHFSNGDTIGKASIAWLVLYGASVALSKLAILLLYLRVFTTQWYGFTLVLILISIVVIGTGVTNAFAAIFQCSPVSYTWDKTVEDGKCLNNLAFARFMAIPNVVDGFVMLAMPIPLVWQLNLAIQQKVALTATFLHGITGFVVSVARLAILFQTDPTRDTKMTAIDWTIWTINEPANYIIAACLPTLRPIFVRIFSDKFSILTRKRDSSQRADMIGLVTPTISLVTRGASRLSGPWDRSKGEDVESWREGKEGVEKEMSDSEEVGSV
ncbi:MAG: hypothetical protein Q9195_009077 [Heterodermia aff. obscurata]